MKQNSLPYYSVHNVGYIDTAIRVLFTILFLLPIFLGLQDLFLIFPLLSLVPFTTAITRWDPLYAVLKMHSRETDGEIRILLANARENIRRYTSRARKLFVPTQERSVLYPVHSH